MHEMMINRRALFVGALASTALAGAGYAAPVQEKAATGLDFPECPLLTADGQIICVEVKGGRVTRIDAQGKAHVIATTGGFPAAVAAGPDGALYVANVGTPTRADRAAFPSRIQRIDPVTRDVRDLVTMVEGAPVLKPDDIVFDQHGGFYFTQMGPDVVPADQIGLASLCYFDGQQARRVTEPLMPNNGIGMSPDGRRLYWTDYKSGRLFARDIIAPGQLAKPQKPGADCLFSHPVPVTYFDSLRVDAEGCISIAVHDGTPTGKSGIMSFRPDGRPINFVAMSEPMTTALALSWQGPNKAYIVQSRAGEIIAMPWPRRGLAPLYQPAPAFLQG